MSLAPFSVVVAEHGPAVLAVCRAMVGPHDADDAWVDTFVAALGAYPDLADDASVVGWLITIARRKCIDVLRKRGRAAQPVGNGNGLEGGLEQATNDNLAGIDGTDAELQAALDSLSERQRFVVVAHHVAGLPYAEIAELLDTTSTAARRSGADAIAKLRTHYRTVGRP